MIHTKQQQGYIVLTAVIILSVVLLMLAHTLSTSGYFQRKGTLEFEFKEASYFLALSCTDRALAKLLQDFEYPGNETFTIDEETCHIDPIEFEGQNTIIETSATVGASETRLTTVVDQDFTIISFQEH